MGNISPSKEKHKLTIKIDNSEKEIYFLYAYLPLLSLLPEDVLGESKRNEY